MARRTRSPAGTQSSLTAWSIQSQIDVTKEAAPTRLRHPRTLSTR